VKLVVPEALPNKLIKGNVYMIYHKADGLPCLMGVGMWNGEEWEIDGLGIRPPEHADAIFDYPRGRHICERPKKGD